MNPYLKDEPSRVGRDPKRKLSSGDRLLRPALMAIEDGETPASINMAIIGAFRFDNPEDAQAVEVRRGMNELGVDATVMAVTGLGRAHPLVRHTVAGYHFAELMA